MFEIQTMQWGSGEFMGPIRDDDDDAGYASKQEALDNAQLISNRYGTITRIGEKGQTTFKEQNYCWPRKGELG